MSFEPCLVCGEEAATGGRQRELSRDQLARLHERAAVFGAWWSSVPGGGGPS
jgi:hypothetical protein